MVYFVIGPSGVGKTSLIAALREARPNLSVLDLDEAVRQVDEDLYRHAGDRWPEFWEVCQRRITEQEVRGREEVIVDVGAGCCDANACREFLDSRDTVVLIRDDPENVFQRVRDRAGGFWSTRTLDQFRKAEFSTGRLAVYSCADLTVDVDGLSLSDARAKFVASATQFMEKWVNLC